MATIRELAKWVGKTVQWQVMPPDRRRDSEEAQDVRIEATIIDVRQAYGRLDFRLQPVHGTGSAWVSSKYVEHTS